MWYIISGIVMLAGIITGFLGLSSCGNSAEKKTTDTDTLKTPPEKTDSIKPSYSTDDIKSMLENLSKTPVKEKLDPGAMCYAACRPMDTSAYVCPVCGEKTLYDKYELAILRKDIPKCRSLVKDFPHTLILDEKQFCSKCSPQTRDNPQLCLIVKLSDKPDHETCGISYDGLEILVEFLKGKTIHKTFNDGEVPIQNSIDQISNLLGVKK
jgi:hypothetical protein